MCLNQKEQCVVFAVHQAGSSFYFPVECALETFQWGLWDHQGSSSRLYGTFDRSTAYDANIKVIY